MFTLRITAFCHSDRSGGISYCFSFLHSSLRSRTARDVSVRAGLAFSLDMTIGSFLPVEIIGLCSFHDHFLQFLVHYSPLAAVGVKTGIAGRSTAARIIGDDVVNKIFVAGVGDLMRLARLKEKRVTLPYNGRSILVANAASARQDEIKFRFGRVGMIRTKRFPLRNPHQREIKRMPLRQIERLRLAPKRDRNILRRLMELALRRF